MINFKIALLAAGRRLQTKFKVFISRKILTHGDDLHIGARTRIWAPKYVKLGNYVYIGKDVHIEANCFVGDYCLIANRVAIIGRHDHDFTAVGYPVRFSPWIGSKIYCNQEAIEEVIIEDDVWVGFGSIILTGVIVGRGSIIAAGSVVTKNIPPYSIAAGVPAKIIGARFNNSATVRQHETAIRDGCFHFSELGYEFCVIEPKLIQD